MPEDFITTLTHADTRDFLRGVSVITYTGAQAEELLRTIFQDPQAQQDAFVALAECGLELVQLAH
jgi:hypothetical protein